MYGKIHRRALIGLTLFLINSIVFPTWANTIQGKLDKVFEKEKNVLIVWKATGEPIYEKSMGKEAQIIWASRAKKITDMVDKFAYLPQAETKIQLTQNGKVMIYDQKKADIILVVFNPQGEIEKEYKEALQVLK